MKKALFVILMLLVTSLIFAKDETAQVNFNNNGESVSNMELLNISSSDNDMHIFLRDSFNNEIVIVLIRGYPNNNQRFRTIIRTGIYVEDADIETYLERGGK